MIVISQPIGHPAPHLLGNGTLWCRLHHLTRWMMRLEFEWRALTNSFLQSCVSQCPKSQPFDTLAKGAKAFLRSDFLRENWTEAKSRTFFFECVIGDEGKVWNLIEMMGESNESIDLLIEICLFQICWCSVMDDFKPTIYVNWFDVFCTSGTTSNTHVLQNHHHEWKWWVVAAVKAFWNQIMGSFYLALLTLTSPSDFLPKGL